VLSAGCHPGLLAVQDNSYWPGAMQGMCADLYPPAELHGSSAATLTSHC
jgi:hypothetical protein